MLQLSIGLCLCIRLLGTCDFCLIVCIILISLVFGLVSFGPVWSFSFLFLPPPANKADQYQRLNEGCALCPLGMLLELIRRHLGAFGMLSSEPHSAAVWGHLDETIRLQVCVTDQRAHLAFRIRTTFGKEGELWFCGVHIPSPPHPPPREAVLCYPWGRGRHGARKEMGSYSAFPPVHCGTCTDLAGFLVPISSTCKMRVIIPPFH